MEIRKTSELSRHTSLLATYWGNKQINNEFNIIEEDNDNQSIISGNKFKLVYDRGNSKVILQNVKKQTESCEINHEFYQKDGKIQEWNNNTYIDQEFLRQSFINQENCCENKSI